MKFQSHEFRCLFANVGYCMRESAWNPGDVSGFELPGGGAFAFDIAAQLEIAYCNYEVRSGMIVPRDHSAGLELNF